MDWVSLAVSIGLLVMWIIAVVTAQGPAWFTWLVFVGAVILLFNSIMGLRVTKREIGRPI